MDYQEWTSPDGRVRLICGDCLAILPTLAAGSVDAVVTDPPYGVGLGTKPNNQRSITEDRQYSSFEDTPENVKHLIDGIFKDLLRISRRIALTPGVMNMWLYPRPNHTGSLYYPSATGCNSWGFSCWQPIFYYGKDPYGGRGSRPDSNQFTTPAERNGHPCPKPIDQMLWLVQRASLKNEIVIDPMMGSGTTGVAAVKLGRRFIGIEIDPTYFAIARERIERAITDKANELPLEFAEAEQTELFGMKEGEKR